MQEPVAVLVDRGPVAVDPDRATAASRRRGSGPGRARSPASSPGTVCGRRAPDLPAHGTALRVDDVHRHSECRAAQRALLDRGRRRRREEASAHLRSARTVDDRATPAPYMLEEPPVGPGVPRLTGRDDRPERAEVGIGLAVRDQCANERRRAAEDVYRSSSISFQSWRSFGQSGAPSMKTSEQPIAPPPTTVHGPHDPAHVCGEEDDVARDGRQPAGDLASDGDEEAALAWSTPFGLPVVPDV